MKRAILVALGTGAVIASAAALGIGTAHSTAPETITRSEYSAVLARDAAREAQRAGIDARYQVSRARCQDIGGTKRDQCLITAHAERGRALLEAQAPYEIRN